MRPVENDDIASFPFERRHATPWGVEGASGKAYIRMGIVLEAVKGRDLSERLLARQRSGDRASPCGTMPGSRHPAHHGASSPSPDEDRAVFDCAVRGWQMIDQATQALVLH